MAKLKQAPQGTSPLVVFLGTAVAMAIAYLAYTQYQKRTKTTVEGAKPAATAQAAALSESATGASTGALSFKIEGPKAVPVNATKVAARATVDAGIRVIWSIENGTIEGEDFKDVVTWSPKGLGEVILTCKAEATDGRTGTAILRVVTVSVPTIPRFEPVPAKITAGQTAILGWTVNDADKIELEPGGDVTKTDASGYKVQPPTTTTYTLKATNAVGLTATKQCVLEVVGVPSGLVLRAEPVQGHPTAFMLHAEFKDGKAVITVNGATIASSDTSPIRVQVDTPPPGGVAELTVTNDLGAAAKTTLTFPR